MEFLWSAYEDEAHEYEWELNEADLDFETQPDHSGEMVEFYLDSDDLACQETRLDLWSMELRILERLYEDGEMNKKALNEEKRSASNRFQ